MDQLLLPHGVTIQMVDGVGTVSDGYHTFNELYKHRCLLFCLAVRDDRSAWKSRLHHDGTAAYEGWFVAGTTLLCAYEETPNGTPSSRYSLLQDITYHLPNEMWELCQVQELAKAPAFDGHTSLDVLDRLERCLDATRVRKN
jgi:hypothetical protein